MKIRSENTTDQILALGLVMLGILFRVVPHPDNFTPTLAIALFSGVVLPPALALTVPFLVMMASDLIIGLHSLIWLVWGTFLAMVLVGIWVRNNAGPAKLLGAALSGSVFFFFVTNLGVFLFQNMYSKDWQGFVQCFTMALPFFRNTLSGDLFYTFTFFALFLAAQWMKQPKKVS